MSYRAKKRFGQNFLEDSATIEKIIAAVNPASSDHLVEIGPGQGAITSHLLPACQRLDVIELDHDLLPPLRRRFAADSRFHLHAADALQFDVCQLQQTTALRLVGNLPYNISTPLIFHLLEASRCIHDMHFMLQKEVVDRLAAVAGVKAYGRLSVMVQVYCEVEALFTIPPAAFNPAPKVDSAFVRLHLRKQPLIETARLPAFSKLVTTAFAHRRKTLRNNLKNCIDTQQAGTTIDLGRRAETLTISEFEQLLAFYR